MPSHRRTLHLSACLLFGALAACAREPSHEVAADAAMEAPAPEAAPADGFARERAAAGAEASMTEAAPDASHMASSAVSQVDPARKFIRTARASFRVEDVYQSALAIEDLVARQGGFVVGNRIRSDTQDVRRRAMGDGKLLELAEYVTRGDLVVRVPSERAQVFLRELVGQMKFLDSRDFSAIDAQFDLLRQQLAYQRGQELQQALGQAVRDGGRIDRKADAIEAQGQALAARDEARVAQREFEDRVAFATIELSLYQSPQVRRTELVDTAAVFEQAGPGFLPQLGNALAQGWRGLLQAIIALAMLWPLWLAAAAGVLGWRALRRVRRRAA